MSEPIIVNGKSKFWHMAFKEMRSRCDTPLSIEDAAKLTATELTVYTGEHGRKAEKPVIQTSLTQVSLDQAMKEVQQVRKIEDLRTIWEKHTHLHTNETFRREVNTAKAVMEREPELDLE